MEQFLFLIPNEEKEKVKEAAHEKRIFAGAFIRRSIIQALNAQKEKKRMGKVDYGKKENNEFLEEDLEAFSGGFEIPENDEYGKASNNEFLEEDLQIYDINSEIAKAQSRILKKVERT